MDHVSFCRKFFASTNIPVNLLRNSDVVYSSLGDITGVTPSGQWELFPPMRNPGFCAMSSEIEYGRVQIEGTDYDLILGPTFCLPATDQLIQQFVQEAKAPPETVEQLTEFLYSVPQASHQQFCSHLAFLHLCLNGEDIDPQELFQEEEGKSQARQERHAKRDMDEEDAEEKRNSYPFEQEMYQCVRNGSVAGLKELFARAYIALATGKMAQSPIRHTKNVFIKVATNVGMLGAIPGGLGVEKTYQLIDSYVQECEQLKTLEEINNLQYMMVLDFCQRVSDAKLPDGISAEVYRCVNFIRSNTNRQLSVDDVARYVHRSNSYMMKRFKQELGIHITVFIMQCKLEEAKRLLQYSDRSLAEISNYLCFSSQSYFQNVFKKQFDITPMQYRKQVTKL